PLDLLRTLPSFPTRRSSDLDCTQLNDVVDCTQLVVYVHDAHQKCVITQCITQNRRLNTPVLIRLQMGDFEPLLFQPVGGIKHRLDRKSTRLNSSHVKISYAV